MLTILLDALDNGKKKKKSFNIERPDNIFFLLGKERERRKKSSVFASKPERDINGEIRICRNLK